MSIFRVIMLNKALADLNGKNQGGGETENFPSEKDAFFFTENEKDKWDMVDVHEFDEREGHRVIIRYRNGKKVL